MKKIASLLVAAAASALFLLTACTARTVIPEEVLQVPEYAPVYTSFNLWYDAKGT